MKYFSADILHLSAATPTSLYFIYIALVATLCKINELVRAIAHLFLQVMGLESGNRTQEGGWMIACVAQRDAQPAIIHPAWLAY